MIGGSGKTDTLAASLPPAAPPVGAIGLCAADSWVGRTIGSREATYLRSGSPVSHVIISLGDGLITDSTYGAGVRETNLTYWQDREIEWYTPVQPFDREERRVLRAIHYIAEGRIPYDTRGIASLVLRGHNKRRKGVYCSFWAAELYLAVRDYDFTRMEQPWNVGIRGLVENLLDPRDFVPWYGDEQRVDLAISV